VVPGKKRDGAKRDRRREDLCDCWTYASKKADAFENQGSASNVAVQIAHY